jgi:hypothetical protein
MAGRSKNDTLCLKYLTPTPLLKKGEGLKTLFFMTTQLTTPTSTLQTIRQLRQQGDLKAAYALALPLYESDRNNLAYARMMGWIYVDRLKEAATLPQPNRLIRGLQLATALDLPADDHVWREQVLWCVAKYLLRATTLNWASLADLIRYSRAFVPTVSTEGVFPLVRSVWFKGLLKQDRATAGAQIDWLDLLDELGWEGFRTEDYEPDSFGGAEGKPGQSGQGSVGCALVERIYMAAARQVLESVPLLENRAVPVLTQLQQVMVRFPGWRFMPYYGARILAALDRKDEAMAMFMPFMREHTRDFWAWAMLAELVETEEQVMACLYRAVSIKTPEEFLVKVRQKLAGRLIEQERWPEAKEQLDRVVETRQTNGWSIPNQVIQWTYDPRYTSALGGIVPNVPERAYPLDDLLWASVAQVIGLVVEVNMDKRQAIVAMTVQTTLPVRLNRLEASVVAGDRLAVRYCANDSMTQGLHRVHTVEKTNADLTDLPVKQVSGPLRLVQGKGFGFVQDVFVPAALLEGKNTLADTLVTVKAYASWDTKRSQAGWRGWQLTKLS